MRGYTLRMRKMTHDAKIDTSTKVSWIWESVTHSQQFDTLHLSSLHTPANWAEEIDPEAWVLQHCSRALSAYTSSSPSDISKRGNLHVTLLKVINNLNQHQHQPGSTVAMVASTTVTATPPPPSSSSSSSQAQQRQRRWPGLEQEPRGKALETRTTTQVCSFYFLSNFLSTIYRLTKNYHHHITTQRHDRA